MSRNLDPHNDMDTDNRASMGRSLGVTVYVYMPNNGQDQDLAVALYDDRFQFSSQIKSRVIICI